MSDKPSNTAKAEGEGVVQPRSFRYSRLAFTGVILVLAAVHMHWPEMLDKTGLGLILIATLPWLLPFISDNFKSVELYGLKMESLDRKLSDQQEKLSDQSRKIDDIYALSMGPKVFAHLSKLIRAGGYGEFYVSSAMPRELEYLENLGFIEFQGKLEGLDNFVDMFNNKFGSNLSEWIKVTEAGRMFHEIRAGVANIR